MTVGVYIRISSKDQKLDSQKAEILRWLNAQNYDPSQITWFKDIESGKKSDRPQLAELQKAIFMGEVKTLVVWKLDRISRSQKDGINLLHEWCEAGVRVVSVTQQIDLSGAVGRMVASVLFGIAEIELQHTKERQAAGIEVAKQKGKYKGRKVGTLKASPEEAKRLKDQGLKPGQIMKALDIKSRTTLAKYLSE